MVCSIKQDKGMMGIGVLIIFISVILVAALAALVLISTVGSLQQRGVETGQKTEKGVSGGIEVVTLMGSDGSVGNDLEHFEMFVRLAPGSDTLNLNHTLIIMDSEATTQILNYGNESSEIPTGTTTFNVEYLKRGPDNEAGYISRGDTLKLRFNYHDVASPTQTTGGLGENMDLRIKIIPLEGTAALVEFKTPDHITLERFTLWP
jgi:flagellin FlaB